MRFNGIICAFMALEAGDLEVHLADLLSILIYLSHITYQVLRRSAMSTPHASNTPQPGSDCNVAHTFQNI